MIGLPVAVLAAAVAGNAYLQATKPYAEARPARERVWPVAIVEAAPAEETPEYHAYGTIMAGRELELRPLVDGRITEVSDVLVEGGVVREGETLVTIDPFDFAIGVSARRAELDESRAKLAEIEADVDAERAMLEQDLRQVALSERDVDRRVTLRKKAATSEKALDDARIVLSERREAVQVRRQMVERLAARAAQQRARIALLEAWLRRDEKDLERTVLTAPFDAFVADVDAAIGQQVARNNPLARLIDATRLDVRFHLGAREFSRLLASDRYQDRPVRVMWRLGAEIREFEGVIERQQSEIDPTTGGVELYARIKGTGIDGPLRPGAFVEVYIPDRTYPAVVSLPQAAMHADDMVYKVVDGRLAVQRVTTVVRQEGSVLVAGLEPGTMVVTTRFPEMGPGLRVTTQ
jgi:RND family efflux transporter MFP subunit